MTVRKTDSIEVKKFRQIASNFCKLVCYPKSVKIATFFRKLEILIPMLCIAANDLPDIEYLTHFPGKRSVKRWKNHWKILQNYIGKYDSYCHVFNPYDPKDTESYFSSLSMDLADIYEDLYPGLSLWNRADAAERRAIIDDWKIMYRIHWSDHAISVFKPIRWLVEFYEAGTKYEDFKGHQIRKMKLKNKKRK
jgi:hypothetical protein